MRSDRINSSYLFPIFSVEDFPSLIQNVADALTKWQKTNPFDTIAFTGVSGAALAFPLSAKLGLSLLCVRKPNTSTHSPYMVEGNYNSKRYVIVDDCIEFGGTVRSIVKSIRQENAADECAGVCLYNQMYGDESIDTESEDSSQTNLVPILRVRRVF